MHPTELVSRRRRLRVTQAQLAAYLGVDVSTVARWEQGRRAIPGMVRPLLHLAEQLPVSEWTAAVEDATASRNA